MQSDATMRNTNGAHSMDHSSVVDGDVHREDHASAVTLHPR